MKGIYSGYTKTARSLFHWLFNFLPSPVLELNPSTFNDHVMMDKDVWLVDFYAPWCGHCVEFAPVFHVIAQSSVFQRGRKNFVYIVFSQVNDDRWVGLTCIHFHLLVPIFLDKSLAMVNILTTETLECTAMNLQGVVKTGNLDCDKYVDLCHKAGITGYPTVKLFLKQSKFSYGDEIPSQSKDYILTFVKNALKTTTKKSVHDEF
uniref:Thioredoxin domain-containing protein n=1 Tax=Timema shepardi TaxID=629360 RepID=A0A7R9AY90_TIMSH|nr:unnamed protein product [Timema shepardi]